MASFQSDTPQRARRLARIRLLIENQRPDELILFADELDIDLLPKVGHQWMLRGAQLEIWTLARIRSAIWPLRLIRRRGKLITS